MFEAGSLTLGMLGYAAAAMFFLLLSLLLVTGRHGRLQKRMLLVAAGMSAAWAAVSAYYIYGGLPFYIPQIAELLRDLSLLSFLLSILSAIYQSSGQSGWRLRLVVGTLVFLTVSLSVLTVHRYQSEQMILLAGSIDVLLAGHLLMAVVGLFLVEQLFRNTRTESRRAVKYLCMGFGALFAYDFYMYADAVMLQRVDPNLWGARGFVNALVVPVVSVAVARDPKWSLDVFVSRRIVFHTTTLLGAGLYLLAMGAGGYYVRSYGGSWGAIAQVTFLFGALLMLMVLLFSGQLRARIRVLISKHFFHYKYDYRDEWLRFSRTLSTGQSGGDSRERAIRAIAEIVESPGGILWLARDHGRLEPVARWNMDEDVPGHESASDSLARFLEKQEWVINLDEYEREPELYAQLTLPDWLRDMGSAWLVAPLILHEQLLGFVVLARSPVRQHFNWEDCDLLKTACRQAASYLAQLEAAEALAQARQFEVCNRLSAYVMHDLKNLIAQLSLVVSNAARHKNNPQFMDDAISTVDNSVTKMTRLLQHLRSGGVNNKEQDYVDLCDTLHEVVDTMSAGSPVPKLDCQATGFGVLTNKDRFAAVLGHVVRNAQDATPDDGSVIVRLFRKGDQAIIEVQDTGAGMDEAFILERLFRPFDSTKGKSGMGIGAYETREFIRDMSGDVSVLSRVGEGTTFRIRLPISDQPQNDVELGNVTEPGYKDDDRIKEIARS